jgi:hypothetical protein
MLVLSSSTWICSTSISSLLVPSFTRVIQFASENTRKQYENRLYILSEFSDQTWSFIRHGKHRELINLTGLYTKIRPHIHLSLNKHGRPKLTQRTNICDIQFAGLKKVKVEPTICTLRWLCHMDVRPTKLHKWHRVFRELGALPKIREEIVSELQMVFEFFRSMWVLLMEVVSTL